ncbi:MAG: DUF1887 family CARF protein [Kiritimatiellia bacterium]
MEKFDIHIVLLSDQVLPNVLAVLDAAIKPQKVILCESDAMAKRGVGINLAEFYSSKGLVTEIVPMGTAYDYAVLQDKFLEIAANLEGGSASVAVNLTGGTKLMSIAAQNVFSAYGFACFYSIPQSNEITVITGEKEPPYKIKDQIKLKDYFRVHGYLAEPKTDKKFKIDSDSRDLCLELLENFSVYKDSIGYLNLLASKAADAYSLKIKNDIPEKHDKILELFARFHFISYYDDKRVEFESQQSRDYCNGLWLEEYVHLSLKELDKDIGLQDFATSLKITSPTGTENELDAAFLYKNNLYIVEAKTARMTDKGTDVLYKLDSLKDYAGMYTRPIVVSFKPLQGYDRKRAEDLKIKLIEGSAIKNLVKHIRDYIEN